MLRDGHADLRQPLALGVERTHCTGHSHWSTSVCRRRVEVRGVGAALLDGALLAVQRRLLLSAMVRLSLGLVTSCRGIGQYALSCALSDTAWSLGGRSASCTRTVTEILAFLRNAARSAAAAAAHPSSSMAKRSSWRLDLRNVYPTVSSAGTPALAPAQKNAAISFLVMVAFWRHSVERPDRSAPADLLASSCDAFASSRSRPQSAAHCAAFSFAETFAASSVAL